MVNESKGPKSLTEFEDRLSKFFLDSYNDCFGLTYDASSRKTLDNKKNNDVLVDTLCKLEKTEGYISEQVDPRDFLKKVLEKDAPISPHEEYLLGVKRDRSGISLPQKNVIAVQAASQVLWKLRGNEIPTVKCMRDTLLGDKKSYTSLDLKRFSDIYTLLDLKRFSDGQTIDRWISEVFPVPDHKRKGRPPKEKMVHPASRIF